MPGGRGKKGQTWEQRERARRAVELKIAGWTWDKIAQELGWSHRASPMRAVEKYFEEEIDQQWDGYFPLLNERAEMLWRQAQTKILEGQRDNDDLKWERGMRQAVKVLEYLGRITGVDKGLNVNVSMALQGDVERLRSEFFEIEQQRKALAEGGVVEGEVVDGGVFGPDDRRPPQEEGYPTN